MNISMVGRHLELTTAIKQHIESSIDVFGKFHLDIISVHAIVSAEEKKEVSIEFTVSLPHNTTVVIKQKDNDLYAAIDVATRRVEKALRRHHGRLHDHKNEGTNKAKIEASKDIDMSAARLALEDAIVPLELDLYKPQEVQDVLDDLKSSEKQFEIFNDIHGKTRVLYKRKDGRFGLY